MPLFSLLGTSFDFEDEPEIFERHLAFQELVMLEAGCGAAHDFAIFDLPQIGLTSHPARSLPLKK